MLAILGITSPIFMIVLIGYGLTHRGLFSKADIRAFGKFVVTLALPALVFKALSESRLSDIFNVGYLLAYATGSLLALGFGYTCGHVAKGRNPLASTFFAMGSSCSNSGFIGYPILLLTLPSVAGVAFALNMMVENLLIIPLLLTIAEHSRHGGGGWKTLGRLAGKLATTPLIMAMVTGVAVSVLEIRLPSMIVRSIDMFAAASGALSLFVIGGTLVGLPRDGVGKAVMPIVTGKLIIHPLGVAAGIVLASALGLAPIEQDFRMAAILSAAMPMMGIYATLAMQYGQEDFATVAQLLTTTTAFFTLSGLLWLFSHFPGLTGM